MNVIDPSTRSARSTSARRLVVLARGVLLVAATLLAAEAALRVAAKVSRRERGIVFDAELGWRPAPDLVRVGRHWSADEPARTNGRGWRDDEHVLAKPAGVLRVVALGDSFTWGQGVDHGERFTEHLEREVDGLEVHNLGVCSYSPDQELRLLETEGMQHEPDVVVVQVFLGNDVDDLRHLRHSAWPKPYYELGETGLVLVRPRATWDVRMRGSCYLGELLYRVVSGSIARDVEADAFRDRSTLPVFVAICARLCAVAAELDAHLLVVLAESPASLATPQTPRDVEIRAHLEHAGVATLDLRAAFLVQETQELFVPDGHWSPAGHALVAREIAEDLRRRGWLARE